MTIRNTSTRFVVQVSKNATNTTFDFDYLDVNHIDVAFDDVKKVYGVDYTINNKVVTFVTPLTKDTKVSIISNEPDGRSNDIQSLSEYNPVIINRNFDILALQNMQNRDKAINVAPFDSSMDAVTLINKATVEAKEYALEADSSATSAGYHEIKAREWAESDTQVEPNKYSAKKWAQQAQAIAIPDKTITINMMADNSIGTNQLLLNAVNNSKIVDNAISNRNIADNAISNRNISNSEITIDKFNPSLLNKLAKHGYFSDGNTYEIYYNATYDGTGYNGHMSGLIKTLIRRDDPSFTFAIPLDIMKIVGLNGRNGHGVAYPGYINDPNMSFRFLSCQIINLYLQVWGTLKEPFTGNDGNVSINFSTVFRCENITV